MDLVEKYLGEEWIESRNEIPMKKKRLTSQQKKALEAYKFAVAQEDRYMGSVFVNSHGQRTHAEKVKKAYDECKRIGIEDLI
jgi:hypothetical protein